MAEKTPLSSALRSKRYTELASDDLSVRETARESLEQSWLALELEIDSVKDLRAALSTQTTRIVKAESERDEMRSRLGLLASSATEFQKAIWELAKTAGLVKGVNAETLDPLSILADVRELLEAQPPQPSSPKPPAKPARAPKS